MQYNILLDSIKDKDSILYFEYEKGITDNLPSKVGNRTIKILTKRNHVRIYKKANYYLTENHISHVYVDDDKSRVRIVPYGGELKRNSKQINIRLSGWYDFLFKYNEKTKEYEFISVTLGGI